MIARRAVVEVAAICKACGASVAIDEVSFDVREGEILYPMIAVSGLFAPVAALPPALRIVARFVPLTYATSLLKGIWVGEAGSAHDGDLAALAITFVICTGLSAWSSAGNEPPAGLPRGQPSTLFSP